MATDWINKAQVLLGEGEANLTDVLPSVISRIIRDEIWKAAKKKDGSNFSSFIEFCEHSLWWGLECPFERMKRYCEHNAEATRLLNEQVPAIEGHGGAREQDSITTLNDRGSTYTLRRLKRDAPELAQQVIDGTLSANQAAIAAGFRKRLIQVEPTPEGFAKAILARLCAEEIIAVCERLARA